MLTELFEIELITCIKMDLALNNLQMLICHKTQPTNQSTIRESVERILETYSPRYIFT